MCEYVIHNNENRLRCVYGMTDEYVIHMATGQSISQRQRLVQEGVNRSKYTTPNDLVHLTPLIIKDTGTCLCIRIPFLSRQFIFLILCSEG